MKRKFSSVLLLFMAVLIVFTGCNPAPSNNGSVKIYLSDASSKAINPDGADSWAGLEIDSYELIILNNGNIVYGKEYAELPNEAIELSFPVGKYDFAANAYVGDVLVAKAEQNGVVVSSRSNAQVNLVVDAFGTGNVEVAFSFAEDSVSNGNITAILTNLATKEEIEMAVEDGMVVANDVPVGSYILDLIADVKLVGTDIAEEKAGVFIKSDIVYVENGKTSSAAWVIKYEGNKASISIDSNVGKPVDFTIQVVGDNAEFDAEANTYYIPVDTPVVLKAVGSNIDDYVFEWNFDGVKTTGSEVTVCYDSYDLGKLSLLVIAKAGSTYGYGYNAWTIESTDFINGTFFVGTADRLAKFASEVNAGNPLFTKGNIVLVADIDLENNAWTPIGKSGDANGKTFFGTFDGQGYTISNLTVAEGTTYAGLFGYTNSATIKNVNFENVKLDGVTRGGALAAVFRSGLIENVNVENIVINANRQSGGIVGAFYGAIKNSSVKNATLSLIPDGVEGAYDNGDKVGGIAGLSQTDNHSGLIENCIVEDIAIKAYRDAGIIIGAADGYILEGNKVMGDNSIVIDQVTNFYGAKDCNAGEFVGRNFDDTEIVDSNAYASDATYDYIVKASRAGALDEVLKLDAREIYVFLAGDATINASDAHLKVGGANTEKITIEGTGAETLELTTTYWSRVNTTNDDAKIVLKNLKLTSSQPTGTWNSYDITFQCDVELEDVDCLKAVALDDTNYASFKDVTISETHDYYALWISTDNDVVDIDGLTVTSAGRGIKIDDQYVNEDSRKVTLNVKNSTFSTAKKSAIIVKSPFGADITVDNIDISNVAADPINAVWVDEDAAAYADLVNVSGCTKKIEGSLVNNNGEYGVDTSDTDSFKEIIADINNVAGAEATVVVPAGEVVLPSDLGNAAMKLSVVGAGIDDTTVNGTPNSYGNTSQPGNYAHGKDLYFKDLTYVTPNSGYQGGFGHAKSVTFENCKIVGQFYCHSGAPHKFINCTIDPLNGYLYTYASDCEFINCTFEASQGKALQVYGEAAVECDVLIDGCTFNAAKQATTWDGKPVTPIDINTANGYKVNVTINNCTSNGFPKGLNSDSDLWNVKNTSLDVFKVTVDGVQVYPYYYVDDVTGSFVVNSANGLKSALGDAGAAGAGSNTIVVTEDIDLTGKEWAPIKVDGYHGADIITLDGGDEGITIKGLTSALFAGGFAGGSGIVIKNITIEDSYIIADNDQGYGAFVCCADSMDKITLLNCHLKNSTIITPNDGADESRIGGLVGWTAGYNNPNDGPVDSYITIENCSVTGCEIKGAGSIGGIVGHAGANPATFTTIKNCVVENNTFISTDDGEWRVGVVVGTANNGQCSISGITESNNAISQVGKTAPSGQSNLYGRFVPAGTGTLTIDGVSI